MAKRAREQALREKRERKQAKKAEARAAKAAGLTGESVQIDGEFEIDASNDESAIPLDADAAV